MAKSKSTKSGVSVAKVSEISARSTKGFEDAIQIGMARASRTLRNINSGWVKEQRVEVKDGNDMQQVLDAPATFHDAKSGAVVDYDPARARAMRFAVAMGAAADTPTAALAREAQLREDVSLGFISADTYYANSGRPEAATLLAARQAEQAALMEQQAALVQEAAASGIDPTTLRTP